MKKILFIAATHGNEPIGVDVLQRLEKTRTNFDWIIGNPKALAQNTRCFEGDLNRSAPGDAASPLYEKRRAKEILDLSKQYEGKATIGKVNVDENPEISLKYGIRSIPTILIIKDGEVVDKQVGVTTKANLEAKLAAHL